MGLYLCVFDASGEEIEGVDVGSYEDFNVFRKAVAATLEKGGMGEICPVLNTHSDSDGEWTPEDAKGLLLELDRIQEALRQYPPVQLNSEWKRQVFQAEGLKRQTLLDSFFDIDGELLVERLRDLAKASVASNQPILFQ